MRTSEIHVRDPFVLPYDGKYYLYGTRGPTCWGEADGFDCYISEDLENWDGPVEIFHRPEGFWADRHFWAPEVHQYQGAFYLFASFKAEGVCRGTQILRAENPEGPYVLHSDGPVTPHDWECLDGTFYVEKNGTPYMVFCHEWLQMNDGEICAVELSRDLTHAVGEPVVLFRASQAGDWVRSTGDRPDVGTYVTDGPFLYPCENGTLLMLWSSFGELGYVQAVAQSENGTLLGPWKHQRPLFEKDGGHGMLFRSFEGQLYLTLHSPNDNPNERPAFIPVREDNGTLTRL